MKPMTWLEIDLGAIRHNLRNLRSLLRPATKFLAVVKANAYGHGLVPVARAAVAAGAEWLGVNSADEALALRQAKLTMPILVLGVVPKHVLADLAAQHVSVVASSADWWKDIQPELKKLARPLGVHMKIETGLQRLGFERSEAVAIAGELAEHPNVRWEGIYSHLAATEERHLTFTHQQARVLASVANQLRQYGLQPGTIHLAASAPTLLYPDLHFDMVRCGIAIYGLWPSRLVARQFLAAHPAAKNDFLRPALTWKTRIVQVKKVTKGTVGYGRTHRIRQPTRVAILPIGYAEGYDRHLSNKGEVLVAGRRCPVIGRVAMNMTAIDVTSIAEVKSQNAKVKMNDEVVLLGRQGSEEITADELADAVGTINYEIVTRMPAALPRIYSGD